MPARGRPRETGRSIGGLRRWRGPCSNASSGGNGVARDQHTLLLELAQSGGDVPPRRRRRHQNREYSRAFESGGGGPAGGHRDRAAVVEQRPFKDRKSTRLNSSHLGISYA